MKNRLETEFELRQPSVKPKQRQPKVTIAIGFIHRSKEPQLKLGELPAIWMASDSQTTYGSTKRENPNKISVIDFANGQILIAQADSVEIGDSVIEKLRRKAWNIKMTDRETAVQAVRAALLEVRAELLEWNKGCNIDLEKFFWTEHRLNLLIGYYFKEKPYLYKMDIYRGIPTLVKSFEAIGGGETLGYFLLKEYAQANPDFDYAWPISVSVVENVIENVDGCGRPTWTGYVYPIPVEIQSKDKPITECHAVIMLKADNELVSHELKKSDSHSATMKKEEIFKVLKRAARKHESMYKIIKKERKRRNRMGTTAMGNALTQRQIKPDV